MLDERIEYKGYVIEILPDQFADSPNDWDDDQAFLIADHRDFAIERKGFTLGLVESALRGGKYEDGSEYPEALDLKKDYHIFGLEAYIHSGVVLSLSKEGNFPDRNWDVSQLGYVLIFKGMCNRRDEAKKAATGLINTWNQYLSGDVWNVNILDDKGETIDGGGSQYGYDEALDMAKSTVDRLAEWDKKAHEKALKAQIKNNVPFEKRN